MRLRPHDLQAVAIESEGSNDGRVDRGAVRERGAAKPGRDFRGDRRATDVIAALEDQSCEARFREERRGDEAVHAGADDDDVKLHKV